MAGAFWLKLLGWHPQVGTHRVGRWVLELTLCQADMGSEGIAQDVLLAIIEGEGAGHA